MSVVCVIAAVILILFSHDAALQGTGVSLLLTVSGSWFIPGAAKQVAYQVSKKIPETAAEVVKATAEAHTEVKP
jgi:hypothetical protein